jgi:hypothetical protein
MTGLIGSDGGSGPSVNPPSQGAPSTDKISLARSPYTTKNLRIVCEGKSVDEICMSIVKEAIHMKGFPGQAINVLLAVEASHVIPQWVSKGKVEVRVKGKGKAKAHAQCYTCGQFGHISKGCPKRVTAAGGAPNHTN